MNENHEADPFYKRADEDAATLMARLRIANALERIAAALEKLTQPATTS